MRWQIVALTSLGLAACGHPSREQLVGESDPARRASIERMNEGTALVEAGRQRAGAAALKEAVRIDADNRDAWLNLGANHYNEGRYQDARRAFARAVEGDGETTSSELAYAMGLALVGLAQEQTDHELASDGLREAISWLEGEAGEVSAAQLLAGTLHEGFGATEAANRAYRRAVKLDPTDGRTFVRLGALYADHGFFAEAVEVLRTGTRLAEDPAPVWAGMGRTKGMAGDLPGATQAYRSALALEPGATDTMFGLGMALGELGEIDEAVELLERYLQAQPLDRAAQLRAAEWRVAQLHLQQVERDEAQ